MRCSPGLTVEAMDDVVVTACTRTLDALKESHVLVIYVKIRITLGTGNPSYFDGPVIADGGVRKLQSFCR